jgi:glycyl-tRNA synthetase beta chain
VPDQVLSFLTDRLKVVLRDRGVRHDLIAAVFAVETPEGGAEDDLVRLLARVDALERFLGSDDGANLLVAYRRAANIVRIEEKKDKTSYGTEIDRAALQDPAETALFEALETAARDANAALGQERFGEAMQALAALRRPVDAFFEQVTVNAEDAALRRNRLSLLKRIGTTLAQVADFARIEG